MIVEIDYDSGYSPEQSSVDLHKNEARRVCDKPNGIDILLTETNFEHSGSWTAEDVEKNPRSTRLTILKPHQHYIGKQFSPQEPIVMVGFWV